MGRSKYSSSQGGSPSFAGLSLRTMLEKQAGRILSHVSMLEHGVGVMMICEAENAQQAMLLRGNI